MRNFLFAAISIFAVHSLHAQEITPLQENTPYLFNGLEYGFYITNEASKEVKGDDYDRFEITLYVSNKSSGIKLIPFPNNPGLTPDEMILAEFNCKNATGKRLTAKGGTLSAKPWFTNVKIDDPGQPNKFRFIRAQVGYAIKSGQTITSKIIIIVPKGERPNFTCRTIYYQEV